MYRSEHIFKSALIRVLKKAGINVVCIETGGTARGIPDLFVMGFGSDGWIELKNLTATTMLNNSKGIKIPWREGQQAWAREYYVAHKYIHYTLTICAHNDSFIVIPMVRVYKEGYVREADAWVLSSLSDVAAVIKDWLKESKRG